jgi:hypothetical protein
MCLTFNYVAAQAAATEYSVATTTAQALDKLANANHDGVSCDNLQITILSNNKGGMDVISRLPVKSDTAKMAMYNIPTECLGTNDCYLKPCDKLPCNAHLMQAWMTPGEHVDIPERVKVPVYRSLGGGGGGGGAAATYTRPTITLPAGVCVEDKDGSKKMTFKTGSFASTDAEIARKIESGVYRDNSDYLLSMRDACWKELQRQLNANGVKMHHLFECTGEVDADGNEVVEPEAVILFMDMLYPNLIPQHDIILCLPPLVGDELVMDAAFNVLLSYPDFRTHIPLLGAHHNDVGNPSSVIEQEENLFICANFPLDCVFPNSETGAHIPIPLHASSDFLPDISEIRNFGKFSSPTMQAQYDAILTKRGASPDFEAWESACIRFQDVCKTQIFDSIKEVGKSAGFCADFSTDAMFMTNLIGMRIPKTTTHMLASVSSKQASASMITQRMAKKKRDDATRNEADSLSPPKRTAVDSDVVPMETQTVDVSDGASSEDAAVDALLVRVVAELRAAGAAKIGAHAMAVYMAKGMDANYITSGALVIDSINFASMTTNHKAHLAAMIQSLAK